MLGSSGSASGAVQQVHKPTMGGAVVLIILAFLVYHFLIAKKR